MSVVRRLAYVRSGAGGVERALSIGASCCARGSEFVPWRPPDGLRDYATRLRQALARKIPASRAADLEVEVGVAQVEG
ncbi:MAG: hypothetical protein K0M78_03180, partial [Brevundimonas sp.]|nr:hypothetical protein [Brevundimonas sp.]